MEWSRVKSIMIGIFCILNIVLFISYISSMRTSINISEETIQNTVTILENNNVTINADIISRKMQDIRTFDVLNKYESPISAVQNLWQISQNEGLDYFNPQFTTSNNTTFEYKSSGTGKIENISVITAQAFAKKAVTKLGLDAGMTVESVVNENNNGNYIVTFRQVYEGNKVLDTCLTFELNENGVTKIYGTNWLCDGVTGGGISSICSITEILVNFAVSTQRGSSIEITDIQLGYFIGDRDGKKSIVTVVPVWRLTTDIGSSFYYDAQNGDLL